MEAVICNSAGGLILIDREILSKLKALPPFDEVDLAECLSIAVDVSGKTDQIHRWPGEPWETVWRRETQPLVERMNAGDLSLVLFNEGVFVCDLDVASASRPFGDGRQLRSMVKVPSGVLIVAELGRIAEDWEVRFPVEYDSFAQNEFTVAPGWYEVLMSFASSPSIVQTGRRLRYGTAGTPFCTVRISQTTPQQIFIEELPRIVHAPDKRS